MYKILEKKLSEDKENIKSLLLKGGVYSITAPTGVGKTYTMHQIGAEILNENSEYIFVFTAPMRIQSEQNSSNYNSYKVISGVHEFNYGKINNIVYDKLDIVLNNLHRIQSKNKKIIFIIDEAHETVYAKNYRSKAIAKIKQLSEIAYTTVHLTATPRPLEPLHSYTAQIEYKLLGTVKTQTTVKICEGKKTEHLLTEMINNNHNKKKLIYINDKNLIKQTAKVLESRLNKKVLQLTADTKNSPEFKYLVENNKLPEGYDVILCTSILNAGVNIKNKDLKLIYYALGNSLNLDYIKQFLGRTRQDEQTATIIIPKKNTEEVESIQHRYKYDVIETYFAEITQLEAVLSLQNNYYKTFKKLQTELNNTMLNLGLKELEINIQILKESKGNIKFDTDLDEFVIDHEYVIKKIIESKDSCLLYDYNLWIQNKSELEEFLNTNLTIELVEEKERSNEGKLIDLKESEKKQLTKDLKKDLHTYYNSVDPEEFESFSEHVTMMIKGEEKSVLELHKNTLTKSSVELIERIEEHHNLLDNLKKHYFINRDIASIQSNFFKILASNKMDFNILKVLRFKHYNKVPIDFITKQESRLLGNEYLIIRRTLEPYIKKSINSNILLNLYKALNKKAQHINKLSDKQKQNTVKLISTVFSITINSCNNQLFLNALS